MCLNLDPGTLNPNRVEIEYFISLLSLSPPLPQLAHVKPEPALVEKLRGIYINFSEEDAVCVCVRV